jgi:hypothetical protein
MRTLRRLSAVRQVCNARTKLVGLEFIGDEILLTIRDHLREHLKTQGTGTTGGSFPLILSYSFTGL